MDEQDQLEGKLLGETARCRFKDTDMTRAFARGQIIEVNAPLDLIDVAGALKKDDVTLFGQWTESGAVSRLSDDKAREWVDCDAELWAVVVAPWVLVQRCD